MGKGRMEAFSDGVIAILITIMVLELKVPRDASLEALRGVLPAFLSYVLSFIYLGIYWNNHHHLLQLTEQINGKVLWANLNLLFWLSLIPFTTAWMGENHFDPLPAAVYGVALLSSAMAYWILQGSIVRAQGEHSELKAALGRDLKGKFTPVIYAVAIGFALYRPVVSEVLYVFAALVWLVPDSRIESVLIPNSATRSGEK